MTINTERLYSGMRRGMNCLNFYSHRVDMILVDTKITDDEKFSELLKLYNSWIEDMEVKKNLSDGFIRYMTDLLLRYLSIWSQLTSDSKFDNIMNDLLVKGR